MKLLKERLRNHDVFVQMAGNINIMYSILGKEVAMWYDMHARNVKES